MQEQQAGAGAPACFLHLMTSLNVASAQKSETISKPSCSKSKILCAASTEIHLAVQDTTKEG